jgi:hypothetical protein
VDRALARATAGSPKGPYQHGQAHEIIELVAPDKVKTLKHGQRVFDTLGKLIKGETET